MSYNIFTIPPHHSFLPNLAKALMDGEIFPAWSRSNPFWLADIKIYLPTRRASQRLGDLLLQMNAPATMLPDIRTLGGEIGEEELFLPPFDAQVLPRAISHAERQLILAMQVESFVNAPAYDGGQTSPAQILQLAEALAELIDDFKIEQVPINNIQLLDDQDLSDHWRHASQFLKIVREAWPQILDEFELVDQADLRNLKLRKQADFLANFPPATPVLIAGSTASTPATAQLLQNILALPHGAVVLPGFDPDISAQTRNAFDDVAQNPFAHPQYGMVKLLQNLRISPAQVRELGNPESTETGEQAEESALNARARIVAQSLDLAQGSANWHAQAGSRIDGPDEGKDLADAFATVALIKARHQDEEALAVAIATYDHLNSNKSVGILSPDRNLSRRIMAHLARFDIAVDDSAGTPLFQTRMGRLIRQILALAQSKGGAVDLIALLHNADIRLGHARADLARFTAVLEKQFLRGQPPHAGLDGLLTRLQDVAKDQDTSNGDIDELVVFVQKLNAEGAALFALFDGNLTLPRLVAALDQFLLAVLKPADEDTSQQIEGFDEWQTFVATMQTARVAGPKMDRLAAPAALSSMLAQVTVRNVRTEAQKVHIYGRLEARLQHHDVMHICGLNENIWPEVADPGPWMGRNMRMAVGLQAPERRHGLAAHDFLMACGNRELVLSQSARVGASPSTPSRFLERLLALLGKEQSKGVEQRGENWLRQAQLLDQPEQIQPAPRPAPAPPANKRPNRISFSRVETLIRSPFDIYARNVLRLSKLDDLGLEAGGRERGNISHEIFAKFVQQGHDVMDSNAHEILKTIAAKEFEILSADAAKRDIWQFRFDAIIKGFLDFERRRNARVAKRYAETDLSFAFDLAGEPFELYGRADRIDMLTDGTCEIIDFKSGSVPSKTLMKKLLAPQLPLEGFVVANSGFERRDAAGDLLEKVAPHLVSALTYVKISNSPTSFEIHPFALEKSGTIDQAIKDCFAQFQRLAQHFLRRDDSMMIADLLPDTTKTFPSDYDHLARKSEWSSTIEEG